MKKNDNAKKLAEINKQIKDLQSQKDELSSSFFGKGVKQALIKEYKKIRKGVTFENEITIKVKVKTVYSIDDEYSECTIISVQDETGNQIGNKRERCALREEFEDFDIGYALGLNSTAMDDHNKMYDEFEQKINKIGKQIGKDYYEILNEIERG